MADVLSIEIAYALPAEQQLVACDVPMGTTARQALAICGIQASFPALDIEHCPLGVFGREVADDYQLQAGDRLEIYRPLINDPREARRTLAAEGKSMGVLKDPHSN
jgi:putative ubiquitin-RnfH superfamily antitoxin RatB of RatAB toxin-antitoxin module